MPALDHPSPADLQAFAIGALPEDTARAVESHLAECPSCLAVAAAAPDDTLVTLLRSAETSQAGPVTPGPAYAETIGLSQAGPPAESVPGPPELAHHTRYRLIRPLGHGGMGHVWLAEHTVMGRPVALKLIRPEFLDKPDAVERFRREVRAAAKLKHPNIVAAHDADQAGGLHFLVMEYIDGETLAERIAAGPVPAEDACRWAIDAARGLEHARENGLIHRDVKPHNLILERATGRVKVLDFGLAGVTTGEASGLTGGNVVIGTPDYISPEQAEDPRTADTRSDVYSLGCTLYHLLAGRPPFPGDAVLKKLDAHRLRDPEPLTAIRQDMTPALAELVARMLAKDPADRPQTPGEVASALEDILAGRGGEPPGPARGRRGGGGRWRRWRRVAVGALVLLGVLGAIVYKLTDEADISVSNEAPDQVKWVIKKDGYVVSEPSRALLTSLFLPAGGEYTVELDRPDEFVAFPKSFAVRRGEKLTIRVVRAARELQPAAVGPAPSGVVLHGKPDAPWTDLLPLVDVNADRESGRLDREDHDGRPALRVKAPPGFARVALPVRPDGEYEVRTRITRLDGRDSFNLMLPIPGPLGRVQVGLVVDGFPERGGITGLEWTNGPNSPMAKTFGGRLVNGRAYDLLARVTARAGRVGIRAELDGTPILTWDGPWASVQNGVNFFTNDRRHLGFGACASTYRVERFEVRMLSGAAQMTRPGPVPAAKTPDTPTVVAVRPDAPWTELLPLVDPREDKEVGWFTVDSRGGKRTAMFVRTNREIPYTRARLPFRPAGSYEVRATFARAEGVDGLVLMLPVPEGSGAAGGHVALFVDGYPKQEAWSGLQFVNDQPVGRPMKESFGGSLQRDKTYRLLARVSVGDGGVDIRAELDGKVIAQWRGPRPELHTGDWWTGADNTRLGVGTYASTFRIDELAVRTNPGAGEFTRAPRAPKTPDGRQELAGNPDARWVNLLDGLSLPTGIVDGTWGWSTDVQKVSLVAGEPKGVAGRFALPVWPKGDYELRLRFARTIGDDGLVAMLPVPGTSDMQTALILDGRTAKGGFVGIEYVDKQPFGVHGKADQGGRFENGTVYTVVVRVRAKEKEASIRADIDGRFEGGDGVFQFGPAEVTHLTPHARWFTPDRGQLGLGVGERTRFRIEAVDFRPLSGNAVWKPGRAPGPKQDAEKPGQAARFGRYRGAVIQIALAPDGKHVFAGEDGVSKWDVNTRQIAWANDGPAGAIPALSGDGKVLLVCDHDGFARVLDPASGQERRKFPIPRETVTHVILNKDGSRAFVSHRGVEKGAKPAIRAWDVTTGKELFRLDGHTEDTYGLAWSPDGSRIATASYDQTVRLWDAATGKEVQQFVGHTAGVSSAAFSADGKYLVTGGGDDQVRVWSLDEKRCVSLLTGHTEWVTDAAFTPDGTRVVSVSGYEGKGDGVRVWDWRTGDQLDHFPRTRGAIGSVAVTPDGRYALTGEHSGEVRLWRLPGPPVPKPETVGPVRRFGRFQGSTAAVALGKDAKHVYAHDEGLAGLTKWDLATGRLLWSHTWGSDHVSCVAVSPRDGHLLVGFDVGVVRVLDPDAGREIGRLTGHEGHVLCAAVSPDGKRAVTCSGTREKELKHAIRVWDLEAAKPLFELKGPTDFTWYATYSKDGTRIATASDDGTVRVWDANDGKELAVLKGHKGMASAVAFSPDGKRVASGGQDLTVRVWDVARKEQVQVLEGHDVWVTELAYTADGTRLVSVGANWDLEASDGVRVWDATTGKPLYEGTSRFMAAGLAVLPDGRYAVTGGMDGAIRVWKLPDPPGPVGKD